MTKFLRILVLVLFVAPQMGCSENAINEFLRLADAKLDNWSQSNPLTIYAYPFKPDDEFDADSDIGKIAWDGAVIGIGLAEVATGSKVQVRAMNMDNVKYYRNMLSNDSMYNGMGRASDKKGVLKSQCEKVGTEGLLYGLYDGDDIGMKLTMYLYVKRENIIVKDRAQARSDTQTLVGLRDNLKYGRPLTASQEQLQMSITEKSMTLSMALVNKYIYGQ